MDYRPPQYFDFSQNGNWSLWKQKFCMYLKATGKGNQPEDVKIAIFLTCIGDEGIDIYNSFEDDKKDTLEKLLQSFDTYVLPKTIIPMETFKFNNLMQSDEQTIDQYLTELKKQAKLCNFVCQCKETYENRMIRDQLVLGIKDKDVQERILRESDLTVEKIIDFCKSIELSRKNIKLLTKQEQPQTEIHALVKKINCQRCLSEHIPNRCPAYG